MFRALNACRFARRSRNGTFYLSELRASSARSGWSIYSNMFPTSSQRRFEKIVEESPTFDGLQERYGRRLGEFLKGKVEVVEGDVSQSGLGVDEATQARLAKSLDLIVNSAGLTDFNPDLREAMASNV